jgi:hypothetical protein
MDKLTSQTLSNERLLIQWLIPGLIALLPYYMLVTYENPKLWNFLTQNGWILTFSYIILSISLGLVLEIIGSYIEVGCFDKYFESAKYSPTHPIHPGELKYPTFRNDWETYLKSNFKKDEEPVIMRYIRSVLFKMKFELALGLSIAIMLLGFIMAKMFTKFEINPTIFAVLICFFIWAANRLIRVEARNSAYILLSCRRSLVDLIETKAKKQKRIKTRCYMME